MVVTDNVLHTRDAKIEYRHTDVCERTSERTIDRTNERIGGRTDRQTDKEMNFKKICLSINK